MRFVPIAPISLQREFDRPVLFALAHMLKDGDYSAFFKETCKYTYCILDNGAYEGSSLPLEHLMYLTLHYGFKEFALPDALRDDEKTYTMTRNALKAIFSKHQKQLKERGVQLMIIPQGNSILTWATCAQMLVEEYMVLFPHWKFTLGVPKITAEFIGGRGRLLERHILPLQRKFGFDIHLLGISESVDQLRSIATKYGQHIRSIDSARPFVWAMNEQQISVLHEPTTYPRRAENYFEHEFNAVQTVLAEANVSAYERICLYDGQPTY